MAGRFRYSSWGAWWHGRQDGRCGIPTADQEEQPPYIRELKELAEGMMHDVAVSWREADKKLKPEYCNAKGKIGRETGAHHSAQEKAVREKEEFIKARTDAIEKSGHPRIGKKVYYFLAALIGVLEYPLNAIVFQVFGQNTDETRLISALLVVLIPFAGHFLGEYLRDELFLHNKVVLVKFICTLSFLLFVLLGVAYIRELMVFPNMQTIVGEFSRTAVTATFFAINGLAAIIVTALSYNAHDPHPEGEKARTILNTEEKDSQAADSALAGMDRSLEKAREVFDRIANLREATFRQKVEEAREVQNRIEVIIQMYWTTNLRHRKDKDRLPKVYTRPCEIAMPESLKTLDTNCLTVGDVMQSADIQEIPLQMEKEPT